MRVVVFQRDAVSETRQLPVLTIATACIPIGFRDSCSDDLNN